MAQESRYSKYLSLITIEPILLIYCFASVICGPTEQAFVYHKLCMAKTNHSELICKSLDNSTYTDLEDEIQTEASHWFLYLGLSFDIPSVLVTFFYGSLSDHSSRKLAMILPIVGQIIAKLVWTLLTFFPECHMGFLLIGHLVSGLFGGWVTLLVGCFSYLSDITLEENRTGRIGVAESMINISVSLGFFVSGIFLEKTNYHIVFGTVVMIYLMATTYTIIRINEPEKRTVKPVDNICSEVFSPRAVKRVFVTVFRKREKNRRMQMGVLFLCLFLGIISTEPSWALAYLYTKKQPLSWSQSMYGIYSSYQSMVRGVALLLMGLLFKRGLGWKDTSIMIFSLVTNACGEAFFGFSVKTWMVFLVPAISVFGALKYTCQRALLSTMVDKEELGQMFAVFGSLQSLSMLVASLIYNNLYPLTLPFWHGLCFVIGASLAVFPLGLFIWLHLDLKKRVYQEYTRVVNEDDEDAEEDEEEWLPNGKLMKDVSDYKDSVEEKEPERLGLEAAVLRVESPMAADHAERHLLIDESVYANMA